MIAELMNEIRNKFRKYEKIMQELRKVTGK